ncbi:MAG: hypothetical protein IKI37_11565 [Oscillospiraceae bacterium]|nr:hypothetical protein [Oscillospiraceae bacterium]
MMKRFAVALSVFLLAISCAGCNSGNADSSADISETTSATEYEIEGFEYITEEPADWSTNYMNYFINIGTVTNPNMRIIYSATEAGFIPQGDVTNFAKVKAIYDIYRKVKESERST